MVIVPGDNTKRWYGTQQINLEFEDSVVKDVKLPEIGEFSDGSSCNMHSNRNKYRLGSLYHCAPYDINVDSNAENSKSETQNISLKDMQIGNQNFQEPLTLHGDMYSDLTHCDFQLTQFPSMAEQYNGARESHQTLAEQGYKSCTRLTEEASDSGLPASYANLCK